FVPTWGEIGTTTGPATPTRPAADDSASRLSSAVSEPLKLPCWTSPGAALPLASWLPPTLALTGPFRLVPTWGLIGATIGPATPPNALDSAPWLSRSAIESLTLAWVGSAPPSRVPSPLAPLAPALPLSLWLLRTLALTGPFRLVATWGAMGTKI